MKKLLIGLSVLSLLLLSGCAATRISFNNIKNSPVHKENVAIIKDDYFHFPWTIKKITFLNKSTGRFEKIFSRENTKPGYVYSKFVLQPGIYNIMYSRKSYKGPWAVGSGEVKLKAGHEYRVNHGDCSLYNAYKRICRLYTDTIWFEDLTTGDVLSGCKWKHLSDKTTSFINEDGVACESIKKD